MSSPRKEQIKNLKTKYTRFNNAGTQSFGGSSVQNIQNTFLENFYDDLVNATVTKTVGGAETSSQAILYAGNGLFSISAGNQFSITLPGVNSDLPITVTIIAGDIVSLGGVPVLTTSRAASRINSTLSGFGVATPVAFNQNGQLILKSANTVGTTFGDDASIRMDDVTVGVLTAFGFGAVSTVSANGVTAPTRGVITHSSDGQGGVLQLRRNDATPAVTSSDVLRHYAIRLFVPETPPGQTVFARILDFPGSALVKRLQISYFRQGLKQPQAISGPQGIPGGAINSDFSTLNAGDSITITLTDPTGGLPTVVVPVSFGALPTSTLDVANIINSAWNAATLALPLSGIPSGQATVISTIFGPYSFDGVTDNFFLAFDGGSPIKIQPASTVVTTAQLVSDINATIGIAGIAIAIGDTFEIRSSSTDGTVSSVQVFAGSSGASPGTDMNILDKLGLSPGLYRGSVIADRFGNDEIRIFNPSRSSGATLSVSGLIGTMNKLGFSAALVSQTSIDGIESVAAPIIQTLFPEMMEFGEVPDDADVIEETFVSTGNPTSSRASVGVGNQGFPPIIGQDGRLDPSFLKKIVDSLSLNQLTLGSGNTFDVAHQSGLARLLTPYKTSSSYMFIWESIEKTLASPRVRLYIKDSNLYLTTNAYIDSSDTTKWFKDTLADPATLVFIEQGRIHIKGQFAAVASFSDSTDWLEVSLTNPHAAIDITSLFTLGSGYISATDALIPRIGTVPNSTAGNYTLIWQNVVSGGTGQRLYTLANGTTSELVFTTNAFYDGVNWNKDVAGAPAITLRFSGELLTIQTKTAAIASWVSWDSIPFIIDAISPNVQINATRQLNLGGEIVSTATDAETARIRSAVVPTGSGFQRTLVHEYYLNGSILAREYSGDASIAKEITVNARWDATALLWIPDVALAPASRLSYRQIGITDQVINSAPLVGWTDAGWDNPRLTFASISSTSGLLQLIDSNINFFGTNVNLPIASTPLANSIYANNIHKAWGYIATGAVPVIQDGFNFTVAYGVGPDSKSLLITFKTPMIKPYHVDSTFYHASLPIAKITTHPYNQAFTSFYLAAVDAGGVQVDLPAAVEYLSFAVIGTQ